MPLLRGYSVTWRTRLTFLNLFDVILEAVEATTKLIILEIQLGPPYNVNLGDRLRRSRTMEKPVNTSFAKTDILNGASKSPRVTAFTAKRDCGSDSYTLQRSEVMGHAYQFIDNSYHTVKIIFWGQ